MNIVKSALHPINIPFHPGHYNLISFYHPYIYLAILPSQKASCNKVENLKIQDWLFFSLHINLQMVCSKKYQNRSSMLWFQVLVTSQYYNTHAFPSQNILSNYIQILCFNNVTIRYSTSVWFKLWCDNSQTIFCQEQDFDSISEQFRDNWNINPLRPNENIRVWKQC